MQTETITAPVNKLVSTAEAIFLIQPKADHKQYICNLSKLIETLQRSSNRYGVESIKEFNPEDGRFKRVHKNRILAMHSERDQKFLKDYYAYFR